MVSQIVVASRSEREGESAYELNEILFSMKPRNFGSSVRCKVRSSGIDSKDGTYE